MLLSTGIGVEDARSDLLMGNDGLPQGAPVEGR